MSSSLLFIGLVTNFDVGGRELSSLLPCLCTLALVGKPTAVGGFHVTLPMEHRKMEST